MFRRCPLSFKFKGEIENEARVICIFRSLTDARVLSALTYFIVMDSTRYTWRFAWGGDHGLRRRGGAVSSGKTVVSMN